MPQNKPNVSKTVMINPFGKPVISSAERESHSRVSITEDQLADDKGAINVKELSRILGLIQDNSIQATSGARTDPLQKKALMRNLTPNAAGYLTIQHGLGEPFGQWWCVGTSAGATPFSAALETYPSANWPAALSPNTYLVIKLGSYITGTYDIAVCPQ